MRVSTGIAKLDRLTGGGFPKNSSILIRGPPGTGKSIFCQQFIYNGLLHSEKGFYITSDSSPEDIISIMGGFSWDIASFLRERKIMFLDIYSWKVGGSKEQAWKKVVEGGPNLDYINHTLSELLDDLHNSHQKRGVFDSLSTLLLYIPSEMVIKFIPIFVAKAKKHGATNLLVLEEGIHDEKTVNTLNFLTDGLIETKMENDVKYLRIGRMKGTSCRSEWIEYDITKKGLKIK